MRTRTGSGSNAIVRLISIFERIRAWTFTALIRSSFRRFGKGSCVDSPLRFAGLHDVAVEAGVNINRYCWISAIGEPNSDGTPKVTIGAHCGIGEGATIAAAQRIVIGERVFTARNVYISDHGHEYRDVEQPIMGQGISEPRPVHIGDGTWLGQNACVLPGVTIGRRCVVGANAVVTKDVPDFCVVAGVPAVVIRRHDVAAKKWVTVTGW